MYFRRIVPFALLLLLVFASCDLLKPRDPETPGAGNNTNPPATSAQVLIETNLASAIVDKNVNEYAKVFSDTNSQGTMFSFVPTQKAAASYGPFFTRWTKDSELNYFRKAMASVSVASTPAVSFTNVAVTLFQADSALYAADYSLFLSPTTYVGRARFYIQTVKSTGTLVVYRWEDFPSARDSTVSWSDLKGQFSQ